MIVGECKCSLSSGIPVNDNIRKLAKRLRKRFSQSGCGSCYVDDCPHERLGVDFDEALDVANGSENNDDISFFHDGFSIRDTINVVLTFFVSQKCN